MTKKASHERVIKFIRAVRQSFPDASIVYQYGGCYGFHLILKDVFPTAVPYLTEDKDHVVTRIGGRYYDINGEYVDSDGKLYEQVTRMTKRQRERWEAVASSQRLEFMLAKYSRVYKRHENS